MPNNTFEDYKKAVKNKYEIEKDSTHFVYLNNPTRARLRNLCWELFQQQNRNQDDLNVFSSLLGLSFDVNKKNRFDEQIDKFRPIETFFKGETDPTNVDAVNLAAILVDFKSRPFNKFRIQGLFEDEIEEEENSESSNLPKEQNDSYTILDTFLEKKEREKGIENKIERRDYGWEREKGKDQREKDIQLTQLKPISLFVNTKEKVLTNLKNRFKKTVLITLFIFGLITAVIYFAFFKNHCMQWSDDHYEVVDCSSENNSNVIIPYDENLVDFRKLKACDTTSCFKKNGEAFVWYGKTANGIDFFNNHGRHPENNNALRPVTHYMFNKYLKNKPCK